MAVGLAALPFASVCNLTGNVSSHSALGGCLDEAVFDQINQLGLEGLDTQLMGSLESINPQVLEDLDSDSGLSLESSSGGPVSPGWFKHYISLLPRLVGLSRHCLSYILMHKLTPHPPRLIRDVLVIQFILRGRVWSYRLQQ